MGTDLSGVPGTDATVWDGFLEAVRAHGVRAPYDRWYMIRGEHYLKAYPDTPLITEIRRRAYSIRTEQAYEHWACRFIAFRRNRDPRELGAAEVRISTLSYISPGLLC